MQVIEQFFEKLARSVFRAFEAAINLFIDLFFIPLEKFLDRLGDKIIDQVEVSSPPGGKIAQDYRAELDPLIRMWDEVKKMKGLGKFWYALLFGGGVALSYISAIMGVAGRSSFQYLNSLWPNAIPRIDDALDMWYRDRISTSTLKEVGEGWGMKGEWVDGLITSRKPLLTPDQLREAFYRLGLSDAELTRLLSHLGYDPLAIQYMKSIFPFIPPPQDLIRMAVREAFSPEIAQRFGQYEDFPAAFATYAQQQGISSEWAQRYWAAHWALPSAGQGFEMLHRGAIGMDDLNLLLRAQDVMPFWRDKLVKISYRPFTRVDVRRMYNVGVLSPAEVKRAYMDLGYDSAKAEKMTQFTILWQTSSERDLTKADIEDGFRRGLLPETEAIDLLEALGYSDAEARFYIQRVRQKMAETRKKAVLSAVKKRFEKGVIDEAEAIDRLAQVGIIQFEIDQHLDLWKLTRGDQVWAPSPADLQKYLRKNIITEDVFTFEAASQGVSQKYINWLIMDARG